MDLNLGGPGPKHSTVRFDGVFKMFSPVGCGGKRDSQQNLEQPWDQFQVLKIKTFCLDRFTDMQILAGNQVNQLVAEFTMVITAASVVGPFSFLCMVNLHLCERTVLEGTIDGWRHIFRARR